MRLEVDVKESADPFFEVTVDNRDVNCTEVKAVGSLYSPADCSPGLGECFVTMQVDEEQARVIYESFLANASPEEKWEMLDERFHDWPLYIVWKKVQENFDSTGHDFIDSVESYEDALKVMSVWLYTSLMYPGDSDFQEPFDREKARQILQDHIDRNIQKLKDWSKVIDVPSLPEEG